MKKASNKLFKEMIFYVQRLPLIKQLEALDFIKWLWGGPGGKEKEFSAEEIKKMEALAKKRGGAKFKDWKSAKSYLESLMR